MSARRQKRNYKVAKVGENEHFSQHVVCIKLQPLAATKMTSTVTRGDYSSMAHFFQFPAPS